MSLGPPDVAAERNSGGHSKPRSLIRRCYWLMVSSSPILALMGGILMASRPPQEGKDPYFSPSTSDAFIPLALGHTLLAHVWVFGILRRRRIVAPPPPPPAVLPPPVAAFPDRTTVAVVTGSNTGIGFETARRLVVEYGWEVVLACRSREKALLARDVINRAAEDATAADDAGGRRPTGRAVVLDSASLDLGDFASVRAYARAVAASYGHIDVLINNAGRNTSGRSAAGGGSTRRRDGDGGGDAPPAADLDLMFQSNYLGHFLLTGLLLDELKAGGKVINLSSVMHHFCGSGPDEPKTTAAYWKSRALYHPDPPPGVYGASKLAAILHSVELNRRYADSHGIHSLAVNPGSVSSDIWRGFPSWVRTIFRVVYLTPEQGSAPLVAAALRGDEWAQKGVRYVQPYWIPPSSSSSSSGPAMPYQEMLGPYVGYAPTTPRLPATESEVLEAARVLWTVSEELTDSGY